MVVLEKMSTGKAERDEQRDYANNTDDRSRQGIVHGEPGKPHGKCGAALEQEDDHAYDRQQDEPVQQQVS